MLFRSRLYACDCSLDVTLVLVIFDMILSKYQLVPISSSFPPTECFSSKDDDYDENTLTAAAEMDARIKTHLEKDLLELQLREDAWSQVMLIVGTITYMNINC